MKLLQAVGMMFLGFFFAITAIYSTADRCRAAGRTSSKPLTVAIVCAVSTSSCER